MSSAPNDFRIEIVKARPQGIVSPLLGAPQAGDVLDITDRVPRDGFGAINRAMERDLLSFKTGDLTLTLRNWDGFFDDLFAFLGPTDAWGLRVYRRGEVQFHGAVIGVGSIIFDRKGKTVDLTAYGLTKLLDQTAASGVSRTIAAMTVTTATAGASTITLNSTSGLLSGDVLHITDHEDSEDVTIKQVTSATVCSLEAALVNTFASGTVVECTTPFYRYKTVEWLVEELFTEAGVGIAELRISPSQFDRPAPTPINISGFDLTYFIKSPPVQKDSIRFQEYNSGGNGKSYYQAEPDDDWTQDDTTSRPWVDWSRYYTTQPTATPRLRSFGVAGSAPELTYTSGLFTSSNALNLHAVGYDFESTAGTGRHFAIWSFVGQPAVTVSDTTDYGATWAISTPGVVLLPTSLGSDVNNWVYSCAEYVNSRNEIYCQYSEITGGQHSVHVNYDTFVSTSILQADDAGYQYYGFCYIPDKDYVVALRGTTATGPNWQIAAFRGTSRLWVRDFPPCLMKIDAGAGAAAQYVYPTQTMRLVGNSLICLALSDGALQVVTSNDDFTTYKMAVIEPATNSGRYFGGVVNGAYAIAAYSGTSPRGHSVAAPFYAGVIEYADFDGLSVAEGLKKLAVLTNSLFWIDDDLQGHFVARDLYDAGAVQDVGDRVMEQSDSILWDETAQYVTVSGNGQEATAGDDSFAAEGIDLESSFIPNEAFAQALADSYYAFYSKARKYVETEFHDRDGRKYQPLDRVTLGGVERYLVYESDHGLTDDRVQVTLLEDV